MEKLQTNTLALLALGALLLVFFEVAFLENGSFVLVLLGIGLIHYSMRSAKGNRNAYFWTGVVLLGISVLSMLTLRLFVLVFALYLLTRLWKGEEWQQVLPRRHEDEPMPIRNRFLAAQSTPIEAYEWKDIHVQSFIGDVVIDTTRTVLPKRTSLVSIRQGFGKVRVIVPYEIPVRVHYSTLLGDIRLFNREPERIWYGTVHAEDGYDETGPAGPELIISLTTWMGDVEVIRR